MAFVSRQGIFARICPKTALSNETQCKAREPLVTTASFHYVFPAVKPGLTTVIFDFGGVLGLPLDPVRKAAMERISGLSAERFREEYHKERLELDRGTLPVHDYWRRILAAGGVEASPELIARIEREDALGWSRVNRQVVAWSYELRAAGYRTGILSNMPTDKLAFMRADGQFEWIQDFHAAVFSCDYQLVKPEASIYKLCLEKLGASAAECLFLDDVPGNVEAARAVGIPAVIFTTVEEMRGTLGRDWGLPVASLFRTAASG